jgi:hypothetical protein
MIDIWYMYFLKSKGGKIMKTIEWQMKGYGEAEVADGLTADEVFEELYEKLYELYGWGIFHEIEISFKDTKGEIPQTHYVINFNKRIGEVNNAES